jgi:hypothetical protein
MNYLDIVDRGFIREHLERYNNPKYPRSSHYMGRHLQKIHGKWSGGCVRQDWYEWFKVQPTNLDAKRMMAPRMGDQIGNMFLRQLEREGCYVIREFPVSLNPPHLTYPINGRIDAIVVTPLEYEREDDAKLDAMYTWYRYMRRISQAIRARHITFEKAAPSIQRAFTLLEGIDLELGMLELKSTHARGIDGSYWDRRKKAKVKYGVQNEGPRVGHVAQISFYHQFFPEISIPWHDTKIIYISREDSNRIEFDAGDEDSIAERTFQLIKIDDTFKAQEALEKYVEEKKIPPRTFDKGMKEYPCSWCQFRTRCYKVDKTQFIEEDAA